MRKKLTKKEKRSKQKEIAIYKKKSYELINENSFYNDCLYCIVNCDSINANDIENLSLVNKFFNKVVKEMCYEIYDVRLVFCEYYLDSHRQGIKCKMSCENDIYDNIIKVLVNIDEISVIYRRKRLWKITDKLHYDKLSIICDCENQYPLTEKYFDIQYKHSWLGEQMILNVLPIICERCGMNNLVETIPGGGFSKNFFM